MLYELYLIAYLIGIQSIGQMSTILKNQRMNKLSSEISQKLKKKPEKNIDMFMNYTIAQVIVLFGLLNVVTSAILSSYDGNSVLNR